MKPTPAPQPPASSAPNQYPVKHLLFLHLTLLLYSIANLFAKYAGLHLAIEENGLALLFTGLEFLTLLVYTVLWQQVLKRMPLSFAYSNKAICTLWTFLIGLLFFGETLTIGRAIGILVVLLGVWLVVTDHA